jgi:protease-4
MAFGLTQPQQTTTMFSRRHPYLFFFLMMVSVSAAFLAAMALVAALMVRTVFDKQTLSAGQAVGVVQINGMIDDSRQAIEDIQRFRDDDDIKAIVVRIDSPGGAVGPSQEIYREIRKTGPTKKVIASLGAIAASGGYYIAAAADGIVANPGTLTGSIGVIMGFTNLQQLLEKIGLTPVVVKSGQYKDIGSPLRPMTDAERQLLESFAAKIHRQFIHDVAQGRQMTVAQVEALADGRIFTAEEVKDAGLIDQMGNLNDAIEWAGRLGGIQGKVEAVYARENKFAFLDYLIGQTLSRIAGPIPKPRF